MYLFSNSFFKYSLAIALGSLLLACTANRKTAIAGVPPYEAESKALHDTIAQLDSLLFDAYNTCKPAIFAEYVSDSIEFYHVRC